MIPKYSFSKNEMQVTPRANIENLFIHNAGESLSVNIHWQFVLHAKEEVLFTESQLQLSYEQAQALYTALQAALLAPTPSVYDATWVISHGKAESIVTDKVSE